MSYILDALRKSETERRQGKVPDLGHQVQLIHRPKKKPVSPIAWLALALIVNAGVLAVVFWPGDNAANSTAEPGQANGPASQAEAPQTAAAPLPSTVESAPAAASAEPVLSRQTPESGSSTPNSAAVTTEQPVTDSTVDQGVVDNGVTAGSVGNRERPTIIVPRASGNRDNPVLREPAPAGRVPHLVELPLSFQKSVPDLTFNSHIFASDPYASRVMINSNYLRQGDSFSGLRVERITQEGVVLSKQGQRFRVGIVRDWVSPR